MRFAGPADLECSQELDGVDLIIMHTDVHASPQKKRIDSLKTKVAHSFNRQLQNTERQCGKKNDSKRLVLTLLEHAHWCTLECHHKEEQGEGCER